MLTVIDEYTRRALTVHVRTKLGSAEVLEALYPLIIQHGKPEFIRSDNGPEFGSDLFQTWLKRVGIEPIHIYPGSPWDMRRIRKRSGRSFSRRLGYNERFNGTLRNPGLRPFVRLNDPQDHSSLCEPLQNQNANGFQTTQQAQATINCWIKEYNHIRPHQGLGMKPPVPETTTLKLVQTKGD